MFLEVLIPVIWWHSVKAPPLPQSDVTDGNDTEPWYYNDIIIPRDNATKSRSFLLNEDLRWPSTYVKIVNIPYVTSQLDPTMFELLQKYIREFEEKSCIRWEYQGEGKGVGHVVAVTGYPPDSTFMYGRCGAYLGNIYWMQRQYLYLDTSCSSVVVPHEMMHVLGFTHEQQRLDRDCYITVAEEFIGLEPDNYEHTADTDVTFPYDPTSVMQYWSYRGEFTSKFGDELGPTGDSLSELDWMKVNYIYCDGPHVCQKDPVSCHRHEQVLADCDIYQQNRQLQRENQQNYDDIY